MIMRDNARECGCLRCWARNHPGDPNWPVLLAGATTEGTIEVQVPCEVVFELDAGRPRQRLTVRSACRFFGHTVAEARGKAIQHLRQGVRLCPVATVHSRHLYWPPLENLPSRQEAV